MIRKYQTTDTEAILHTWYQASLLAHPFLDTAFLERERGNIREIYLPNTETWVYEDGGRVVGFISMMGNEVGAIFLQPEYHGRGIGRQLMDRVAQIHEVLEVEVFERNAIGRAFYDRYGFKPIGAHRHEETGQELVRMKFNRNAGNSGGVQYI
ncbi:MAG: GNAT family N-acetyltransferase [Phaeodactylibacter sp.]|nr:GNAT family N-acetyltransferase [Phaeodactylibacter sp.]